MAKTKRVEDRSPQANYQRRQLEQGKCIVCPEPRAINPKTGAPYRRCTVHHASWLVLQAALMKQRRADGRA